MKIQVKIRAVEPGDIPQLVALCKAHAAFEKTEYLENGQEQRLLKDLFSKSPRLFGLVVEQQGRLLGFATYMKQYATWDAREYVYMDCLFLQEGIRGLGIGKKIIKRLQEEARKFHCGHLQWQTPELNTGAIRFYKTIGASYKSKERFFLTSGHD